VIKIQSVLLLALVCGCGPDPEIGPLRHKVVALEEENTELRKSLPVERPALLKELDEAKLTISKLRVDLAVAKISIEKANGQVPPEMLPLAAMILDLKGRVAALESNASMKGHTHVYEDKYPLNTFNSSTRTTEPAK